MTPIYNVITNQRATMPCSIWGNRSLNEVLDAQALADGWRYERAAAHGARYKASIWSDDGFNYTETAAEYTDEEWAEKKAADAAAEAAARLASFAPYAAKATLFRETLRKHFGPTAETDRAVTATRVAEYFMWKQLDMVMVITTQELADAIVLDKLFAELAAWNGTGETWTLPWSVLP
jgi:hypothetical protein